MSSSNYLYGDLSVMGAGGGVAGRPRILVGVGDSIENAWFPAVQQLKDDAVGTSGWVISTATLGSRGPFPPASPGAHVTNYNTFSGRQNTGSTTLNGATIIGASSIVVNSPFGGGTGVPAGGMAITIDSAGQQETLRIANSYDGVSLTLPLASTATKTHANGVTVSWKRQSGQAGYSLGSATEILFATAASPQDAAWFNGRLLDCSLLGESAYADQDESYYWRNGRVLNPGSIDVILLYLALPVNSGAPNLRLRGRTGEASPTEVTTDFSLFAASPTIKAVKLTVPTPGAASTTTMLRTTVNSPNAGNFTAGQVFVILDLLFLQHSATGGTAFLAQTYGGMAFSDADNSAYGGQWTPAYQVQWASALQTVGLNVDAMLVSLGVNSPPASAAAVASELTTLLTNLKAANASATMIGVTTYANPSVGSTVGARLRDGYQTFATNAGACVFDWYSASGDPLDVSARYLSDTLHPNSTLGTQWAGDSVNGAFRVATAIEAGAPAASNVRNGIDRGDGVLGTILVPDVSVVLANAPAFDAGGTAHGTYTPVGQSNVRSGVTFGPSSGLTGNLALPATGNVLLGVGYGSAGTELVGTYPVGPPAANQVNVQIQCLTQQGTARAAAVVEFRPDKTNSSGFAVPGTWAQSLPTDSSGLATCQCKGGESYAFRIDGGEIQRFTTPSNGTITAPFDLIGHRQI